MGSLVSVSRRSFLLLALAVGGCSAGATAESPPPVGPYLGQRAGEDPALFAPGIVSRRFGEMNAAFSPDGLELYFAMKDASDRRPTILVTRRVDGIWQPAEVAAFSGLYDDVDPLFSPDGSRLYFSSYRPRAAGEVDPAEDADIWYVERGPDGAFGAAVHVGAPVSTPRDDFYPSVTRDGTLYYAVWDGKRRTGDIFRARLVEGAYVVEDVGAPINTEATEYDPFVAPDESYLVFTSTRPGGRGDGDLYVSFRGSIGWSEAVNLAAVNTPAREYCPVVSPDGEYFFFTSARSPAGVSGAGASTVAELTARYDAIENGLGNVYWLRSDFLGRLRPGG